MEQSNLLILLLIAFIAYCCMMKKSENFPSSKRYDPNDPPNLYESFCQNARTLEREIRGILEECDENINECRYDLLKAKQDSLKVNTGLCKGDLFTRMAMPGKGPLYRTPQPPPQGPQGAFNTAVGNLYGKNNWNNQFTGRS